MIVIAFILFAALVLAWLAVPSRESRVMSRELTEQTAGERAGSPAPAVSGR